MGKFDKKSKGGSPAISTASLPDIVFMLLFFFMVSTTMKEVDTKVYTRLPDATQVKKIENKSLVSYIYIGTPKNTDEFGTTDAIQLNDQIANIGGIQQYVEQERAKRKEKEVKLMTFSLKVDEETKMGIVVDVKEELRKVQALRINYASKKKESK